MWPIMLEPLIGILTGSIIARWVLWPTQIRLQHRQVVQLRSRAEHLAHDINYERNRL